MTDREPAEVANLDCYGNPELPWSRACRRNAAARGRADATLAAGGSG
jgi:hypothetical protein